MTIRTPPTGQWRMGSGVRVPLDLGLVDLDASDLRPGVVLRKQYRDELIEVTVVRAPGGIPPAALRRGWWRYMWRGKLWRSLSAIAAAVTGDRYMSGNRWFGLRMRRGACRGKVRKAAMGEWGR